ncbi:hypothetical protein H3146_04140 [Streptomyces sp. OF3]|uniref:Uncharacterized protein n=1 Tax=Streptomyces alkaliterrae TaxID=2213162 RepID=A0A7W3ZLM4_9ACTN|nr:hypothetical protein [Streptomyces alkaliterrae]MBB1252566.1 hypothetical protein [Streptomyces alkaliterrae]
MTLRDRLIAYVTTRLSPVDWRHAERIVDSIATPALNTPQTAAASPELPAGLTAAARQAIRDHSTTYLKRLAPPLNASEGRTIPSRCSASV